MPSQPANENPPKVALVTGAARRIGKSIALRLAESGWHVAIHYRKSAAKPFMDAAEVRLRGGKAMTVEADLMHEDQVETIIPKVAEHLGALSLLVNNASTFEMDKAETATRTSWDKHIEANLRAPFVLSQAFARQFTRESGGNIINLLDQRVWKLTPYFISYTVAKMGLWTLTRTLALSYAPRIRVNGIVPGPALPSPRQTREQFERQCRMMPLRRGTTPAEICAALRFILAAPAMTGQMIALDGGQHLPVFAEHQFDDIVGGEFVDAECCGVDRFGRKGLPLRAHRHKFVTILQSRDHLLSVSSGPSVRGDVRPGRAQRVEWSRRISPISRLSGVWPRIRSRAMRAILSCCANSPRAAVRRRSA